MGLGKTLQTLSLLAYIKEDPAAPRDASLVVCPLSVLSSWENVSLFKLYSLDSLTLYAGSQTLVAHNENRSHAWVCSRGTLRELSLSKHTLTPLFSIARTYQE